MSFEGYHQALCKNGHASRIAYDYAGDFDWKGWRCPEVNCGSELAWTNIVDETNCLPYPDNGEIKLQQKTSRVVCVCITCGHQHVCESPTYHIPAAGCHH